MAVLQSGKTRRKICCFSGPATAPAASKNAETTAYKTIRTENEFAEQNELQQRDDLGCVAKAVVGNAASGVCILVSCKFIAYKYSV
jgi:hypothetical protein